jgi:hypothetical protein
MSDNINSAGQLPPAGWYPDPHDAAAQRYWDGVQWTAHTSPGAPADGVIAGTAAGAGAAAGGGAAVMPARRGLPSLKWWQWALIALGVLVLIGGIASAVGGERASDDGAADDKPAAVSEREEEPAVEEEPVETVDVPDLVGLTVGEARVQLEEAGLTLAAGEAGDDWIVTAQRPGQGEHPVEGLELSVTSEAPKPVYTLAQQNAIDKARDYLDYSGFSRSGLIGQLEFEGYSTDDATFGADNAGADWNAEAAEKAESYLEYSSFSRQGLYDQLAFEGFTDAEIQFGLAAVGY